MMTNGCSAKGCADRGDILRRLAHDGQIDLVIGELPHDKFAIIHPQTQLDLGVKRTERHQ